MHSAPPAFSPIRPGSLRSPTGRGRPYPAELVAAVQALVEDTGLRFEEFGERTGVGEATVGRWARRGGWRRSGGGWEVGEARRHSTGRGVPQRPHAEAAGIAGPRSTRDRRASLETPLRGAPHDEEVGWTRSHVPRASRVEADHARQTRCGRYGPAEHEAARALIVGSRLGLERIGQRLGIGGATLARWQKRFRWRRPAPDRPGPQFYRSPRRRGRPYAADAVGIAQRLVTETLLSQAGIAAQAGVSQATVSNWIRRRGWTRPAAKPGSHRFAASRRTAPVATSGDRRGRCYDPRVVAATRDLYETSRLSTSLIAARVQVSAVTVERWAAVKGWTRPNGLPDRRRSR